MTAPIRGLAAALVLALLAVACGDAAAGEAPAAPEYLPASSYVGLAIDEAGARADEEQRPWRVVRLDGEDQAVTQDYSPDRLNFDVEAGVVTAAATDEERAAPSDRSSASFVGLRLDEAGERADRQDRAWRVIRLDGEDQAVTADFQEDRLNFTVEQDVVTAAATDAELATTPPEPGCDATLVPAPGAEVLGRHDLDGDGRAEFFVLFDGKDVGITTLLGDDCQPAEVTLDGAPARFAVFFDEGNALGLACRNGSPDHLYATTLESQDGELYGGRIAAYDLDGATLVDKGGEGAEMDRAGAAALARVDCGDVQHP